MPSRAALLLALLAFAGAAGCGDPEPAGRFQVVQRGFPWRTPPGEAPSGLPPLTLRWSFAGPQPAWHLAAGSAAHAGDSLRLHDPVRVTLQGPGQGIVLGELRHLLVLSLRVETPADLHAQWQGGNPLVIPLEPTEGEGFEPLAIPLASLFSVRTHDDVPDFTLAFEARDERGVDVRIAGIDAVSDYEDAGGEGFVAGELARLGIRREAVALKTPGAVEAAVPAAAGDRLRFALASLGPETPMEVVVSEASGRFEERRLACDPTGRWSEHAFELPEASPSDPLRVVFRVERAPEQSVLLVGSLMRLRRNPELRGNLLLYVEDTLRADRLGGGHAVDLDPHLQAVAAQGLRFERVWSTASWTRPAVSTLMTGLDPVGHGNRRMRHRVPDALETLAEALAAAGWVTASFTTNHHAGSWAGLHQGFDAHHDPIAFAADDLESTLTSTLIHEPIAAFLAEHADEQVFVYAHSLDPHAPYLPDAESLRAIDAQSDPRPPFDPAREPPTSRRALERQYEAEILHNDRQLALLDAVLTANGLAQDTLLAFVSDHGEAFAEHGQWDHRRTVHEEEVRVPWVMRWPARLPAGRTLPTPASLVDVAPTLVGLLGAPRPAGWTGRDLSALCLGEAQSATPVPLFMETVLSPPAEDGTVSHVGIVSWPFKLHATTDATGQLSARALFRLDEDPAERQDVLADPEHARMAASLLERARARLREEPAHGENPDAGMTPALEERMRQLGYVK